MPERRIGGRFRHKTGKAVALTYRLGLPAPFLAAKASGRAVERFLEIAREASLPIIEDEALAEAIWPLQIGDWVPEEYYEVVAKVFAFVKAVEET